MGKAEDIIRTTLLGVANTLGVRIDIPDETIADLAATLQAEIDRIEAAESESFEFLNELALAFRAAENHPRPQYAPVLEGIRAVLARLTDAGRLVSKGGKAEIWQQGYDFGVHDERMSQDVTGGEVTPGRGNPYATSAPFPATEPAEDATQSAGGDCFDVCEGHPVETPVVHDHHHDIEAYAASFNEGYDEAVRQFTEPVDTIRNFPRCGHYLDEARCTRRIHDGDHEVAQGDEVIVWPAGEPATEPAEEETKAEEHRSIIHSNRTIKTVGEALSYAETALLNAYPHSGQRAHYAEVIAELLRDVARQRPVGSNGKHGELHTPTCGCEDVPASSPVVPAPTETGPWQRIEDVPEGVHRIFDGDRDLWVKADGVWYGGSDFFKVDGFGPFVAAKEG
ncbi:hypothetical protein [Rhodococcus qingshengii]|uniref:hypothetical protein n=1 Tax=Rhodococcus qingshengii TaxID=334542 RepID=UPI00287FB9E5|nr:hypothetical protein [Rhodococcus qingshengii]